MSSVRIFSWLVIAFSLTLGAGLYWKSQGENKGQAAEKINASKETVMTSNLIGHWTFDGDNVVWGDTSSEIKDSTNVNHGNAFNLTRTSVIPGITGQGMRFNGSNDYVNLGTSIDSTGTKTVSLWFKEMGNEDTLFFSSTGDNSDFILIGFYNGDTISVETEDTFPSSKSRQVDGINIGQWYHLVVTKTSGGVTGIYVNGVDQTASGGNFSPEGGTDITYIGRHPSGGYFEGSLDDVRIYNTALTATQVADLYRASSAKEILNANHRESLTNGLVGYWTLDGRDMKWSDTSTEIKDISGSGNHGNALGSLATTSVTPGKLGQGLSFNGTSDLISITKVASLNNVYPVTYSFWMYPVTSGFLYGSIIDKGRLIIDRQDGTGNLEFYRGCTGGNLAALTPGNSITPDKWQHLVLTWDGVCTTFSGLKIYINGISQTISGSPGSGSPEDDSFYDVTLGFNTISTVDYYKGRLDDIRIYNRILSASEILNLYNLGK